MKIRIIPFLLILVLMPKTSFCQEWKTKLIDIGGKVIWLPAPENDMSAISDSIIKLAEIPVPPGNILKAVFLPKDVISKLGIEPVSDRKKVMIEIVKSFEKSDINENDFKEAVSYMKKSFPSDLPEITEKTNQEFEKIRDRIGKQEVGKMEILGTILDSKDAFAYLMSLKVKDDNDEKMIYAGLLSMRVKNRMMVAYFYNYAGYEEAINWIANIIPIWSKKVFELNQEISSITKSTMLNPNQEINNSNNIKQIKKSSDNPLGDVFNGISRVFSGLLLKAPSTFICLVILMLAYYMSSRKLYRKYKNSKPVQPTEYERYMKSKSSSKNSILWAFLRLIEFIIILFILLAILKFVGLSVPSEIM